MKQEDKELLIQELSMRLPYGVYVHIRYKEGEPCYGKLTPRDIQWFIDSNIEVIKPYLIPISEMSDYEIEELYKAFGFGYMVNNFKLTEEWEKFQDLIKDGDIFIPYPIWIKDFQNGIKFLLKNHFDYQGLIPKGLAIAVTKENNPYNITEE